MDWKAQIGSALGADLDNDVLEELAQHAAATYAAARAEGCDARQGEHRVAVQIQAWAVDPAIRRRRPKREPAIEPPAGSASAASAVLQDTRYAWRLLRRQPAYAALVIATMALGIAATTVIGSVAYGVLLKPLPWADAPRLVRLYENRQGSTRRFRPLMTNAAFIEWRKAHDTLDDLGAWSIENGTVAGTPERLKIAAITPGLLPILGVSPALGRAFAPGEEAPGHAPVMLLSHGLWQQRYGGRPEAIGQTIRFETGAPYTIIGVMPAGFAFPDTTTRAWVPFHVRPVVTPGIEGKKPFCCVYLLEVNDSEPIVRPWKPPRKPMKRPRPLTARASLSAASTASVPLWQKKLIAGSPTGLNEAIFSPSAIWFSCQ